MISFLLNMVNGSLQNELSRFFQVIDDEPVASNDVTAAAFCKARKKFCYTAFKSLNKNLIETFYQSNNEKKWHGFRLLAVDGSVTKVPKSPELMEHFGTARSHSTKPACRISQLYDVMNRLTLDLQVGPHSTGERNLALPHLECAGRNDLILYDRGYPANWFFLMHIQRDIQFCVRAPVNSSNLIKEFLKSGKRDARVMSPCIEKSLKRCKKDGLPTDPIELRLIKIDLPSGGVEVLMTSLLDRKAFPRKIFSDLYQQRWGIEEDYKVLKSRLTIENYSGLSLEAVLQDIHAKTLTKNIASVAIFDAENLKDAVCANRRLPYKINNTYALSQIKDNIVRLLTFRENGCLLENIIKKIAKVLSPCRSHRKFERLHKMMLEEKYPIKYKRVC